MSGSTFGTFFKVSTWGESHGKALGAVIDGCPAGLPLCEQDIQKYLNRRKPGQTRISTPRKEGNNFRCLSRPYHWHPYFPYRKKYLPEVAGLQRNRFLLPPRPCGLYL